MAPVVSFDGKEVPVSSSWTNNCSRCGTQLSEIVAGSDECKAPGLRHGAKRPSFSTSSLAPHYQHRIVAVTHDFFGYAAEHPAPHAGAPVGCHSDYRTRCRLCVADNFGSSGAFQSGSRHRPIEGRLPFVPGSTVRPIPGQFSDGWNEAIPVDRRDETLGLGFTA